MKKWLSLISLLLLLLAFRCKTSASSDREQDVESNEQQTVDDSTRQIREIRHGAPDQEKIDSIKQAKRKKKDG